MLVVIMIIGLVLLIIRSFLAKKRKIERLSLLVVGLILIMIPSHTFINNFFIWVNSMFNSIPGPVVQFPFK